MATKLIMALSSMTVSFASGQNPDSLRTILSKQIGSDRRLTLFELAYYYTDRDNLLALEYINEASRVSQELGDSLMIVKTGRLKSLLYRRIDMMDSSLVLSETILPIAERNKYEQECKKILTGLALAYTFTSNYDKALAAYLRLMHWTDLNDNLAEASIIFNNIGLVYYKLNNFEKALLYFEKSLRLKREVKDSFDLDVLYVNISSCYAFMKDHQKAVEFSELALSTCEPECSKMLIARIEYSNALVLYQMRKFKESELRFRKSYDLAQETNNVRHQIDVLDRLFQIYHDTGDISSAKKFAPDAQLHVSKGSFYVEGVIELCGHLSRIFQKTGEFEKMMQYQSRYIQLKDSVFNADLITNLMDAESEILERENNSKLESQERILELSAIIIGRQRALNMVAGVIGILLIALVILLIQIVMQKKRANLLLEQKVKERTIELELNHNMLLKSVQDRNHEIQRLSNDIRSSLATIKGLGLLVSHDLGTINGSSYLAKIEEASDNLIRGLNRKYDQQL